jgi:anti-sigma regulatory factor (Ser/Thr protein kinase)
MTSAADRLRRLVDERGEVANRDVSRGLEVSPATAHRLLRSLVVAGVLELRGKGPSSRYRFRSIRLRFSIRGLEEDRAWRKTAEAILRVRPLDEEELRSLQYAATEVINNAVEHSRGRRVEVGVEFAARATTVVTVRDDGVGVFRRICEDFGFPSTHDAIVGLEKGKLTSDPSRHSGEGLFFSSKAVSRCRLESQKTAWIVDNVVGDSAIAPSTVSRGTSVRLEVVRGRTPRLVEVFAAYADPESLSFARTRATVKLGAYGKTLVSRSEARRLTEGLTKFKQVTLDFSGVETVGQGFCDEVFRVFARSHPEVAVEPVGMNEAVAFMVARARSR